MPESFSSSDPADRAAAVTPSDDTDLETYARALLLSDAAEVKVTTVGGSVVTLPLQAGYNPIRVKRVWATPAPGVSIFALW